MKNAVRSTRQLAEVLGLSRWTVSRALNGHKGLNAATIERVRRAARESGFAPSVLGRGLRAGTTDLLGVCVPDLVDYFLTDKVMRLQKAAAARGLDVLLQIGDETPESEAAALERFASMRCRGVIVVAPRLPARSAGWRRLEDAGIPVVRIDPLVPGRGRTVETDRAGGVAQAVKHLRALGHRRIAAAGISPGNLYGRQRIEGMRAAWSGSGPEIPLWPMPPEDGAWPDFERRPVTAVLAINDRAAMRLIRWADRRGLRVPDDLSLVGYDNAEVAALSRPSLTTIDPRPGVLVERAVELLFSPKSARVRIQPELVVRESTGPVPKTKK